MNRFTNQEQIAYCELITSSEFYKRLEKKNKELQMENLKLKAVPVPVK